MEAINELHIASQYLAATGISFVQKEEDDSHTNLGWNDEFKRLETRKFGEGYNVSLSLSNRELTWLKDDVLQESLILAGVTHGEIVRWMKAISKMMKLQGEFNFDLHYDLPYAIVDSTSVALSELNFDSITEEWTRAKEIFEKFLQQNNLNSPIRIWPHHFDMGIYAHVRDEIYIGAGLALADSVEDEMYFYASGYNAGKSIENSKFSPLSVGSWKENWPGATLVSKGISTDQVHVFYNEVLKALLDNSSL